MNVIARLWVTQVYHETFQLLDTRLCRINCSQLGIVTLVCVRLFFYSIPWRGEPLEAEESKALIERIRQILKRDDTILFVGSGLSTWSGLPSWKKLIEELAEFVQSAGISVEGQ